MVEGANGTVRYQPRVLACLVVRRRLVKAEPLGRAGDIG